ncbi:MAG: CAP domain-containing protein [Chloroflexi bacterium]|nr:CAP domain-containing protein [Chloroflexota bacterium]
MTLTLGIITSLILGFSYSPAAAQGSDQQWIFGQVNSLRGGLGLYAYVWNDQLAAAAQQQSEYLAATGIISHTQANGSTPTSRATANGYAGSMIAENIYGGLIAQATDAWSFWINSGVHYATLTNPRDNEIGIGAATGEYGKFFALVIGYRRDVTAPPAAPVPANDTGSGAGQPAAPTAPPPTPRPPTLTFTPSPTIPTATPTITWTPTFTWTPSPTHTIPPPTSTGIHLPTAQVVAMLPSATQAVAMAPVSTSPPSSPSAKPALSKGFNARKLLPIFLVGQVMLIGVGVYSLFFRKPHRKI